MRAAVIPGDHLGGMEARMVPMSGGPRPEVGSGGRVEVQGEGEVGAAPALPRPHTSRASGPGCTSPPLSAAAFGQPNSLQPSHARHSTRCRQLARRCPTRLRVTAPRRRVWAPPAPPPERCPSRGCPLRPRSRLARPPPRPIPGRTHAACLRPHREPASQTRPQTTDMLPTTEDAPALGQRPPWTRSDRALLPRILARRFGPRPAQHLHAGRGPRRPAKAGGRDGCGQGLVRDPEGGLS